MGIFSMQSQSYYSHEMRFIPCNVTGTTLFAFHWSFAEKIFVKQSLGTMFEILLKIRRYALRG